MYAASTVSPLTTQTAEPVFPGRFGKPATQMMQQVGCFSNGGYRCRN